MKQGTEIIADEKMPTEKELSYYERWQLENYGNVLPEFNDVNEATAEIGVEDQRRFSEWMQHEAEQQMLKAEQYFGCKQDINL